MLVQDIMRQPVVAISPETTLWDAYRTMREKSFRHLPVLDGEKLVGIVTDRDLRLATSALAPSPFEPGSRVSAVMSRPPVTAEPTDPVEEAARVMRERKIGCLPVVDGDEVIGIVTGLDLLDGLIRMTGVDKPSGRLEARLPDHPGELARLLSFIAARHLNVHSVMTYPVGGGADEADALSVVLRVSSIETRRLADELRRDGFDVVWPPRK